MTPNKEVKYTPKQLLAYKYSDRLKDLASKIELTGGEYDDILIEMLSEYSASLFTVQEILDVANDTAFYVSPQDEAIVYVSLDTLKNRLQQFIEQRGK